MKTALTFLLSVLFAISLSAQDWKTVDPADPQAVAGAYMAYLMDEVAPALSVSRDYKGVLESGAEFLEWFEAIPEESKEEVPFRFYIYTLMAEAAARSGDLEAAVSYTREAVAKGCDSYTYVLDLIGIPQLDVYPGFREAIAPLKAIDGDYIGLLRRDNDYRPEEELNGKVSITYCDPSDGMLEEMVEYLNLESVAGDGDEVSRIVNLMDWVHDNIPHNGMSYYPGEPCAMSIYYYSKATGNGVNCRMLATVLNECYLALGFKSRLVACLPANHADMDCHIINAVWSETLDKWLWMDPTYSAYVTDENGAMLGIQEVRDRLVEDKPVRVRPGANWNHLNDITSQFYLYEYMAKNLYILECWLEQKYGTESWIREENPRYIQLRPYGSDSWRFNIRQSTSDPDFFWQRPG